MTAKVAVLGAGYMGSAITFPLSDNRLEVNLWGTWLDDKLMESSMKGYHPKLKKPLPPGVKLFYWHDLANALKEADIIFIAVASEGFVRVFNMMLDNLDSRKQYYFFKLTKGLVQYNRKVLRATEAAFDMYKKKFPRKRFYWTTIGGPVRALDLACRIPSATMYGISCDEIKSMLLSFSTSYYRIFSTYDLEGVEICSTFKNIYAIAAGICDGLYKPKIDGFYHNVVAFLFNQGVSEITKIVELAGRKKQTVYDLAGVGDLHVTSAAGRNRRYGEMIGKGVDSEEAFKKMYKEGEYGEGYIALKLAIPWLKDHYCRLQGQSQKEHLKDQQRAEIDMNFFSYLERELPLLNTLYNIIFRKHKPSDELVKFITRLGF